eukprot:CAMPEP_0198507110 /NCGR_PEP_ID=MMETSP1462-20131121/12109_1 /TAXON_ID=1333877 /ORGANISM="Brandtodinium nutriculum, Strain RCC3387" /LENGTH=70 /DNA_ID=CAMNT_0044236347 /DNA_START=355 /DNA_END=568 /DNA_ORIENTATION=-
MEHEVHADEQKDDPEYPGAADLERDAVRESGDYQEGHENHDEAGSSLAHWFLVCFLYDVSWYTLRGAMHK